LRLAFLDNRDSFSWNLIQDLKSLGADVFVFEREKADLGQFKTLQADRIVIGPGPGHPQDAQLASALFAAFPKTPILGVCLGHQVLAHRLGATITGTPELAHGRPILVEHTGQGLFHGLKNPAVMGRYHSLTVSPDGLPEQVRVLAESECGEILALRHCSSPHWGVQFHPESILSKEGRLLLANFVGPRLLGFS
jgi:anthranilate synthase/aminodeoxychorismate synthase-like glutamine amidotransferase